MEAEKWEKIEDVFQVALKLGDDEREQYLAQSCGEDQEIRTEVESLISALETKDEFLEEPAFDLGMKVLENRFDVSLAGQEIGTYKILEKLGSGGMGDVYLADDVPLKRKVALKFLSDSLVDDARAKRQLFREAQAVALINHPNICPVYDVKEIGSYRFIVMQYIEGKTLSELLKNRQIFESQFFEIARQITEALAAAHDSGIIHRDIKPGNIMLTPDLQIKVLDFGLAKKVSDPKIESIGNFPSLMTQANAIVGTIAYMSPEQLRTEKLDFSSDIFSLGTVLHELVTGKNPFLRNSDAETISAILTESFKPSAELKNGKAAIFGDVIKKCLEKDKTKRYQNAGELIDEIKNLQNKKPVKIKMPLFARPLMATILILIFLIVGTVVYQKAAAPRSLAVLPFVNLSADVNNDFMNGMAETLIQKIAASSSINVRPYTQVANYKLNDVNPVEIGQNLQVDAVLTGKIIRQNEQLVLQTSLINIADGSQLWSENNILSDKDSLAVQNNISEKIVSKLQSTLNFDDEKSQQIKTTENPEAYRFYLQGLSYWKQRDQVNIKKAIDSFNLAISKDSGYALAYSGLAYTYIVRTSVNYRAMPPNEAIPIARANAEKAVTLDPNLSEPHAALGAIFHKFEWNWTNAEREYQKAIELNPNLAQTYYWYSDMLAILRRPDEALAMSLKARELDPFTPSMDLNVGRVLYFSHRYNEAEKQLTEAIQRNPNNSGAKLILGLVYLQMPSDAKNSEALKILESLYALDKTSYAASLGYAYGKLGRTSDAQKIIDDFNKVNADEKYVPAHEKALVYLGLGDNENALNGLETAYDEHFLGLGTLNVDPVYDGVRNDARFQSLLSRMNLK